MKCTICGKQIMGLDYPHEGMLCSGCRSDKAYADYMNMQYELDAEEWFLFGRN